ncbi:HET domain-containing protein [Glonium stellatum]|uniref:HET domain-containing protein n=1 Tax=Glonium stellatum TaxID=574774 RepID=A0A8E2EV36_9PEZI|nr:HET domain-containing protein [Glonium stellatum]
MRERIYKYGSLNSPDIIRLLRLDGEKNDELLCHLITVPLTDAPPYFALSYCWGSAKKKHGILCDSGRLSVTASLLQALQHLQRVFCNVPKQDPSAKWFWIDQICINQEDLAERSQQVKLMGAIYSRSITTLIWLGPVYDSCSLAWSLIDKIYGVFREENPNAAYISDISLRLYSASGHEGYQLPPWEDEPWQHLRNMLRAPWFSRMWIIQEVAVSKQDPIILHGSQVYSWDRLGWAASWLRRAGFIRLGHIPRTILNIDTISNLRRSKEPWKLHSLLISTSLKFQATDPRDKIYALLGLAAETSDGSAWPEPLVPDYSRDTAQVYREVARFLIGEHQSLAIFTRTLPSVRHFSLLWKSSSRTLLESWVPNWCIPTELHQTTSLVWLSYNDANGTELGFPAQYNAAANIPASIVTSDDDKTLAVRGVRIDRITSASGGNPLKFFHLLISAQLKPLFLQAWDMTVEHGQNRSPIELVDAFVKCTTGDQSPIAGSTPEAFRRHGCAYLHSRLRTLGNRFHVLSKYSRYSNFVKQHKLDGDYENYTSLARNYCMNRRFFVTSKGSFGIGPQWLKKGDIVCVLYGSGVPYILRPNGGTYILLGESYIHGLAEGQAVDRLRSGDLHDEVFRLR